MPVFLPAIENGAYDGGIIEFSKKQAKQKVYKIMPNNSIKLLTENTNDGLSRFYAKTIRHRPKTPFVTFVAQLNWSKITFSFFYQPRSGMVLGRVEFFFFLLLLWGHLAFFNFESLLPQNCLLYTSDAADE